jgi:hypothetical protein
LRAGATSPHTDLDLKNSSTFRRTKGHVFGFTSRHHILVDFPNVDRFLAQPSHVLAGEPRDWTMGWRIFGLDHDQLVRDQLGPAYKRIVAVVERNYVNEVGATAALERADIPGHTLQFVSFRGDGEKGQRLWEAAAQVEVLKRDGSGEPGIVEADLHALVRDFGMCIALPQLYGKHFCEFIAPPSLSISRSG